MKERVSKQQDELLAQQELDKARHEEDRARHERAGVRHEERVNDLTMVYQRMQELQAEVTRLSSSQGITAGKPIFFALAFADCCAVGSGSIPPVTVDKPTE
jgi:hypothetical protein